MWFGAETGFNLQSHAICAKIYRKAALSYKCWRHAVSLITCMCYWVGNCEIMTFLVTCLCAVCQPSNACLVSFKFATVLNTMLTVFLMFVDIFTRFSVCLPCIITDPSPSVIRVHSWPSWVTAAGTWLAEEIQFLNVYPYQTHPLCAGPLTCMCLFCYARVSVNVTGMCCFIEWLVVCVLSKLNKLLNYKLSVLCSCNVKQNLTKLYIVS